VDQDVTLLSELLALVEPDARGDPMSPLRWTCKNLSQLARSLAAKGHKVGRTVIASTGRELIGADELGYLIFSLTPRGRTLLASARGNQLGAQVTITQTLPSTGQGSVSPTPTTVRATANVALVRFS